jgi:hypothetical protein
MRRMATSLPRVADLYKNPQALQSTKEEQMDIKTVLCAYILTGIIFMVYSSIKYWNFTQRVFRFAAMAMKMNNTAAPALLFTLLMSPFICIATWPSMAFESEEKERDNFNKASEALKFFGF